MRLLVVVIDFLAYGVICLALAGGSAMVSPLTRSTFNLVLLAWVATAFSYFVVLKRSRIRTLGYRVGRVRAVGLDGESPSYLSLSLRLMFGILGPVIWLVDLAWLSGDTHRQTLHDKLANTYVVKEKSLAAGTGRTISWYYDIGLCNCLFREVDVDRAVGSQGSSQMQSLSLGASPTIAGAPSAR